MCVPVSVGEKRHEWMKTSSVRRMLSYIALACFKFLLFMPLVQKHYLSTYCICSHLQLCWFISPSAGTVLVHHPAQESAIPALKCRDRKRGSGNGFVMYLLTYNQVLKQGKKCIKSQSVCILHCWLKVICNCEDNSACAISNSSSFYQM